MSSSLVFRPVIQQEDVYLNDRIKHILQKKYDQTVIDTIMDSGDIDYLKGLRDAGVEGAKTLIDAVNEYGRIHVDEIF